MVLIALTLGLLVLLFLIMVALARLFEGNRAADFLDWKPTRSPEVEAQNEVDDVQQMLDAQNEMRRRRGLADRNEQELRDEVAAEELERLRRRRGFEAT